MKKIYSILTLAAAMVLAACEHKELCYDHPHGTVTELAVVFDWRNAPQATAKGMSLFLFPEGGGPMERYEFTDPQGGTITVPTGSYRALCLNNDTETILFRGTDRFETFEVYTREEALLLGLGVRADGVPRAEGTEDERTARSPEMLWCDARSEAVEIRAESGQTLSFTPAAAVSSYTVEIRGAENLKYVQGVSGSLSSMAGGYRPGPGTLTEERVIVPFEAVSDKVSTVRAGFNVFGHCPALPNRHQLVLYAVLSDGSKWFYTYDVTDQVHAAKDPRDIHITLEGLPLPKPIVNGGGLQPDVDDWNEVEIDIIM